MHEICIQALNIGIDRLGHPSKKSPNMSLSLPQSPKVERDHGGVAS
jgi:hypothetical protein